MGIKKITVEEIEVLIQYYLELAKKPDLDKTQINKIKMRLGHWNKVKKRLTENV